MKYIAAVLVLSIATIAAGEVSPYVNFGAGFSLLPEMDVNVEAGSSIGKLDANTGFNIEGAVGVALGEMPLRVEAAFFYQHNNLREFAPSDGSPTSRIDRDLQVGALMGNLYFDLIEFNGQRPKDRYLPVISPYVLVGGGIAHATAKVEGDRNNDTSVAGQVGAGVGIYLTGNLVLDLRYKYFLTAQDLEVFENRTYGLDYSSQQWQMGMRVLF